MVSNTVLEEKEAPSYMSTFHVGCFLLLEDNFGVQPCLVRLGNQAGVLVDSVQG